MATVAHNLDLEAGQNVVLTAEQFPGNVYTWRRIAAERAVELRTVGLPGQGARGPGWTAKILEVIDSGTGLVTMAQVHWTDGARFDLETIRVDA